MGALFNILFHSIGSLFLGIIISLGGMALMLYVIRSWHKTKIFTPLSYIIAGVLFLILAYHAIIICGAVTIKGYGDDLVECVNSYVRMIPDNTVFSQEDSQEIMIRLMRDLPIVGYYANYADFTGHTPTDIAESMNEAMQEFMNKYILKHLLWVLVFVIIGAFCIIKTMDMSRSTSTRSFSKRPRRPQTFSSHRRSTGKF